ncbi:MULTISPECIES: hypothetical protein [Streptomyces]|uniref:Uncharacterized protein n=1 Tax=Streptomyces pratisoli TaxID=3139917 RepID=A0ACC6QTG6_9ACTN
MNPRLVIVYPPDDQGSRRVRVDGLVMGQAHSPRDVVGFMRRAGLDPDTIDLADPAFVEWRGGGIDVWSAAD